MPKSEYYDKLLKIIVDAIRAVDNTPNDNENDELTEETLVVLEQLVEILKGAP